MKNESIPNDLICVGKIGKAIGLNGWLNFWPECEEIELLRSLYVWVKLHDSTQACATPIVVTKIQKDGRKILFDNVTSRCEAESLTHASLWVKAEDLPALPQGEFYWENLIGAKIFLPEKKIAFGTIIGLTPTPAYDLLVIDPIDSNLKQKFVPFLPEISVESVNLKLGVVHLTPTALDWIELS